MNLKNQNSNHITSDQAAVFGSLVGWKLVTPAHPETAEMNPVFSVAAMAK